MFSFSWEQIVFFVTLIFMAGGGWFKMHQIHKDVLESKPDIKKIPGLEIRVGYCEEGIKELKEMGHAD